MENNKLIAEFMGMTYGDPNDDSVMIQMTSQGNEVVPIESMKYHISWDWLMPVVEKIESDERYDVDILQYGTKITDNQKEIVNNIADISFDKKIEHTYDAIVKFIISNDYKTCDRCCYDIVDDDGDIMEHICIDDNLY
jgi:hypothetical protein